MSFQLRPSKVHGVGVFALKKIKKGTSLDLFAEEDYRYINKTEVKDKKMNRTLIKFYTIPDKTGYHAPKSFHRMSIGWYLNHSVTPNAYCNDDYEYFALKEIKGNEEITIDYDKL